VILTGGAGLAASGRERRGRKWAGGGFVGRKRRWAAGGSWATRAERGKGEEGWVVLFFFSFSNPFQTNFKTFQNQIFYMFSNSNFNANFSNYFKGFSQTFFLQLFKHILNSNL
jgi:hypothetical protein